MVVAVLVALVLVLMLLLSTDAWVYRDAMARQASGTPVVFRRGALSFEAPQAWFYACLVVWIVFFPIYLTDRRRR
jgi:hypothetical protein